jgi:hypothetical protein
MGCSESKHTNTLIRLNQQLTALEQKLDIPTIPESEFNTNDVDQAIKNLSTRKNAIMKMCNILYFTMTSRIISEKLRQIENGIDSINSFFISAGIIALKKVNGFTR